MNRVTLLRTGLVVVVAIIGGIANAEKPVLVGKGSSIRFAGVNADSPIIYDNDWWKDVPDAAYLWKKASLGKANLRGNVVSRDMWAWREGYKFPMKNCMTEATQLRQLALRSGLKNIPAPVAGATLALQRPDSGCIEDTTFQRTAGSDLIVREAKLASKQRRLVLFIGGPCTTVAAAYLTDPTIADRVMVFQVDGGAYNAKDSWSWHIVQQRLPFTNWCRGYFWGDWSRWNTGDFDVLPDNPLVGDADVRLCVTFHLGT
ncbi:MAG: hypothetical protein AAFN70_19265, partial [Planctomycetota bacterium]